ncbi:MAG: hypothetical protein IKT33_03945 [Clostridia bacterium]|nr:hypothetical protein [Clostridia bacterium]
MEKLSQLQEEKFPVKHLVLSKEDQTILDSNLAVFFMNEKNIQKQLARLNRFERDVVDKYDHTHLFFHARDNKWLVQYILACLDEVRCMQFNEKEKDPTVQVLKYITPQTIVSYITQSPNFKAQRAEYEQNVVKAYINILKDAKIDDFQVHDYEKRIYRKKADYDKIFRNKIVKAMRFLCFSARTYEPAIEKNADLWRDQVRRQTFENLFHLNKYLDNETLNKCNLFAPRVFAEINNALEDIYQTWSAARDYIYYQDNQETIDKLNQATPNMKLSEVEYRKMNRKVMVKITQYKEIVAKAKRSVHGKAFIKTKANYWNTHQPDSNGFDIVKIDEEKLKYWDNHQPVTNGHDEVIVDEEKLRYWDFNQPLTNDGKNIPAKEINYDYWDHHQPQTSNGKPVPQKKHKNPKYWDQHQPDTYLSK